MQPQIIDNVINNVQLPNNIKTRLTPTLSTNILCRDSEAPLFDEHFNYRAVVGKINFLENSTRTNIAYVTHLCA